MFFIKSNAFFRNVYKRVLLFHYVLTVEAFQIFGEVINKLKKIIINIIRK